MSSTGDRDDRYSDRPRDDDDRPSDRGRRRDDDYPDVRRREDIPNYLVPSILVTLFCCLIGGIVAIVNAAQVNSKMAAGDYAGARRASDQAKMWCWISFGVGLPITIIWIIFNIVAAGAGAGGAGGPFGK